MGFLLQAVAWFDGQGVECRQVMSDNGSAYISKAFDVPAASSSSSTFAPGPTRHAPTARPSCLSRTSARNGPMRCRSRTPRSGTPGYPVISRSITGSGSTQPSAGAHPSSDSLSCSADQPGETQHLGRLLVIPPPPGPRPRSLSVEAPDQWQQPADRLPQRIADGCVG